MFLITMSIFTFSMIVVFVIAFIICIKIDDKFEEYNLITSIVLKTIVAIIAIAILFLMNKYL